MNYNFINFDFPFLIRHANESVKGFLQTHRNNIMNTSLYFHLTLDI